MAHSSEAVFVGVYAVPFLLALLLPGFRSVTATGLLAFTFLVISSLTDAAGNMFTFMGRIILLVGLAGLGFGVVTRAISILYARPTQQPLKFMLLVLVGFIVPLAVFLCMSGGQYVRLRHDQTVTTAPMTSASLSPEMLRRASRWVHLEPRIMSSKHDFLRWFASQLTARATSQPTE